MHPNKKMDKCKEVADTAVGTLMGRFDDFLSNLTTVTYLYPFNHYWRIRLAQHLDVKHFVYRVAGHADQSDLAHETGAQGQV